MSYKKKKQEQQAKNRLKAVSKTVSPRKEGLARRQLMDVRSLLPDGAAYQNLLQYTTMQTIEQSNLPLAQREELFLKAQYHIRDSDPLAIGSLMEDYSLKKKFDKNLNWAKTRPGQRFFDKEVNTMSYTKKTGYAPSNVAWTPIKPEANNSRTFAKRVRETFTRSTGLPSSMISVSPKGGVQARFNVQGLGRQASKVFEFNLSLPSYGVEATIPIYVPSNEGFIAQSRDTFHRGFTRGESIYVTPESFFTDFKKNEQTGKYELRHIKGKDSYVNFQLSQIEQLGERIKRIERSKRMSPEMKGRKIKELLSELKQANYQIQQYVGSAAALGGGAANAGQAGAIKNLLSKTATVRQSSVYETRFSQITNMPDTRVPISLMRAEGTEMILSAGMSGKLKMLNRPGYSPGVLRLPHEEPTKALSDISFTKYSRNQTVKGLVPRYEKILQGKEGKLVNSKLFDPTGVTMIGTLIPDTKDLAELHGLGRTELMAPDGTFIVKEDLVKAGVLDSSYLSGHKLKLTGVTGNVGAPVFGTAKALLEGGEVYAQADVHRKNPIKIPGMKAVVEAGEEADFYKALGLSSESEFKKVFPGGISLERGETLGLDPSTGKSVVVPDDKTIREAVIGMGRDSADGSLTLSTIRNVQGYMSKGEFISPENKLVSSLVVRGGGAHKLQTVTATRQQFNNLLGAALHKRNLGGNEVPLKALQAATKAEALFNKELVKSDVIKLTTMAGAYRYEAEDKFREIFRSASAAQGRRQIEGREALRRLAQMPNVELLKAIDSGEAFEQVKKFTTLAGEELERVKDILKKESKSSMDQKLAALSYATFEMLQPDKKVEALGNVFGLYNKYAESIGLDSYGRKSNEEIVERFFQWGGESEATAIKGEAARNWREGKTLRKELDDAFSGAMLDVGGKKKSLAAAVLESEQPHVFYTNAASIRDTSGVLGSGGRASLEPRFFDLAVAKKDIQPAFKEITSRMTNFGDVLQELSVSIENKSPTRPFAEMSLNDVLKRESVAVVGATPLNVDLGLSSDDLIRVRERMAQKNPDLKAPVRSKVYLPGGDHIQGMGMMVTGTGVEKEKPIRQIYMGFLRDVNDAHKLVGEARISAIADSMNAFQEQLQDAFVKQVSGVPKGGQSGALRGKVAGSVYLHAQALGPDILEEMGVIGRDYERFKNVPDDRRALQKRVMSELKKNVVEGGESMGRQIFMSERAAQKMFEDAAEAYKEAGKHDLAEQSMKQLSALKSGGSVLSPIARHPGIGINSATVARLYIDPFGQKSLQQNYFRMGMQYINVLKDGGVADEWMTSLAQDIASDLDGDRISVFAAVTDESQGGLARLMKNEHRHAIRYQSYKELVKQSMERGAKQSSASALLSSTFTDAQRKAMKLEAKKLNASLAHSATNNIVPKISNLFSELKFMTAVAGPGEGRAVSDIFNFIEAAEQVPISSKNLSKYADYSLDVVEQLVRVREGIYGDSKQRKLAVDSLFDLLANDEAASKLNFDFGDELNKFAVTQNDVKEMKKNLLSAVENFHKDSKNVDVIKIFKQRKGGQVDSKTLMNAAKRLEEVSKAATTNLSKGISTVGSGAAHSRASISELVNNIMEKGRSHRSSFSKKNLPAAGFVGIAAAAVATVGVATAANMMFSPTWSDSKSHNNFVDPDLLFPDELESRNSVLHGNSMPTPVSGQLVTSSFQATIHTPAGSPGIPSLVGRLGNIMHGRSGSARLEIQDNRSALDVFRLEQIEDEII